MNVPHQFLLSAKTVKTEQDKWALQVHDSLWDTQEGIITEMEGVEVLHSCLTLFLQKFSVIAREAPHNGHGGLELGNLWTTWHWEIAFLLYALAQSIKAEIPVAWCANAEFCYFFDKNGACICDYFEAPPKCKLALFDTVSGMESPLSSFHGPDTGVFVVQTTSPKLSQYKEWSKQANAELWVMDIWSAAEIDCIRKLKQTEDQYHDPVSVSTYHGPSARYCPMDWKKSGDPTVDFMDWDLPSFDNSDILYDTLKKSKIDYSKENAHLYKYLFVTPNPREALSLNIWPSHSALSHY